MKIKKEQKDQASKIFEANPKQDELFLNNKGEFFTTENLVGLSVKNDKTKYARILRSSVIESEEEIDENDEITNPLEGVKVESEGMFIKAGDKEILFPAIKGEVREPKEGDVATIDGKDAEGSFKYNDSTLEFKAGKLEKITYKQGGLRALFGKKSK